MLCPDEHPGKISLREFRELFESVCYFIFGLQQFQGNFDSDTIVRHYVPRPAMVKSVHIIPIEWETNFAIRLELYGCIAGEYTDV